MINVHSGAKVGEEALTEAVREIFELTPAGMIRMLDLRRPIYKKTAAYGHSAESSLSSPGRGRTRPTRSGPFRLDQPRPGPAAPGRPDAGGVPASATADRDPHVERVKKSPGLLDLLPGDPLPVSGISLTWESKNSTSRPRAPSRSICRPLPGLRKPVGSL